MAGIMETAARYVIPACALLLCVVLYILEKRLKGLRWAFSVAAVTLHVFTVLYFLISEASMETALLFLMASFAAALAVNSPKRQRNKAEEETP